MILEKIMLTLMLITAVGAGYLLTGYIGCSTPNLAFFMRLGGVVFVLLAFREVWKK